MATIPLNDGTQIPWLAFGTGTALFKSDASNLISKAIAMGITHIDCAHAYMNEESVGEGIRASGKSRSELYIVTKLKNVGLSVREALEGSLKRLGVDYVDLYLVHFPLDYDGKMKQVWAEMQEVQKAGLAKSIGVSNCTVRDLEEVLSVGGVVPAVNQIEFHPYVFKASEPILKMHEKYGIVTASYGGQTPLLPQRVLDETVRCVLENIAERLSQNEGWSITSGQVLFKWMKHRNVVVVTTTTKEQRMKEYVDTEAVPDLTDEDIAVIDEAGATMHYRHFKAVFRDS